MTRNVGNVDHLCHYTATTGDIRSSPRCEVGDDVIALVTSLCVIGTHRMPVPFEGYRVVSRRLASGALEATIRRDQVELVQVVVAVTRDELASEWRRLGLLATADLWVPACLVSILPGLMATMDPAVEWLGDFERCLAWAEALRRDVARNVRESRPQKA